MKTQWSNAHDGKSITIRHFKRERDNHEFVEDNFYSLRELVKKKWKQNYKTNNSKLHRLENIILIVG